MINLLSDLSTFSCKVSSVLNRNIKEFGKKHLFDGCEETCWNSDQGSPQFITITLNKVKTVNALKLQFQGGFVGKDCEITSITEKEDSLAAAVSFYPQDKNSDQIIHLSKSLTGDKFKIIFSNSTDFFGRITLYKLELLGE